MLRNNCEMGILFKINICHKNRLILCSPLIAVGVLFEQVLCFIKLCMSVSGRGFKCRLLNVVLLFRHHFMFLRKST